MDNLNQKAYIRSNIEGEWERLARRACLWVASSDEPTLTNPITLSNSITVAMISDVFQVPIKEIVDVIMLYRNGGLNGQ